MIFARASPYLPGAFDVFPAGKKALTLGFLVQCWILPAVVGVRTSRLTRYIRTGLQSQRFSLNPPLPDSNRAFRHGSYFPRPASDLPTVLRTSRRAVLSFLTRQSRSPAAGVSHTKGRRSKQPPQSPPLVQLRKRVKIAPIFAVFPRPKLRGAF